MATDKIGEAPPLDASPRRTRSRHVPAAAPPPSPEPVATVDKAPAAEPAEERANAVSKCVYFYDRGKVDRLEAVIRGVPRCSLAKVLNQLLDIFVEAQLNQPNERCIKVPESKVYL